MKRIATFVTFKKEAVDTVLLNGLRIEAILNIQKKLIYYMITAEVVTLSN